MNTFKNSKIFSSFTCYFKTAKYVMQPTSNMFKECYVNSTKKFDKTSITYKTINGLIMIGCSWSILDKNIRYTDNCDDDLAFSRLLLLPACLILTTTLYPYAPIVYPAMAFYDYVWKKKIDRMKN